MDGFFAPPPDPWPEQAQGGNAPRWTGRPQGRPPGEVVGDLVVGRSESTTVVVEYLDAYPGGFEFEIAGTTTVPRPELAIDGSQHPDIFGRHWPQADERRDVLPPQLLRVGVEFSDGRSATSVIGHDRPMAGPVLWPFSGGMHGLAARRDARPAPEAPPTRFHQGYWISPLPPAGPVRVVCEWPVGGIAESFVELDAQSILDAAERSRAVLPDGSVERDGRNWRLGTDTDVAFIGPAVESRTAVAGLIPPIYAAYCTVGLPQPDDDDGRGRRYERELQDHERAVLDLVVRHTNPGPWWLGYLDTGGGTDVVFPYAPRVAPFWGHQYVLVEAGPEQAAGWRERGWNWALPDLIFPADRSWQLSTGWDDDWTSIGGSEALVDAFSQHAVLGPRTIRVG